MFGCADYWSKVKERNEKNNCRLLGTATVDGGGGELCETVNCDPITPSAFNTVVDYTDVTGKYWIYVPDDDIPGPYKVLITLHGCGGTSEGAPWNDADYYGYHYITVAPDGAETGNKCWTPGQPNSDGGERRILDTVKSVTAHFNIDPRQIILSGYSSGGDLAYRTAFYHSELFAGVLAANTSPFRDTGSMAAQSLAAASWKFNVRHLQATGDQTYPLAGGPGRDPTDGCRRIPGAARAGAGHALRRADQPAEPERRHLLAHPASPDRGVHERRLEVAGALVRTDDRRARRADGGAVGRAGDGERQVDRRGQPDLDGGRADGHVGGQPGVLR